jgi:translocation and assembly module TamB
VASLDVTVAAQNRILVRGRGLDAELGGLLRLQGTSAAPVANGAFTLRRGKFALAGQTLELVRGSLSFSGDLTPDLDFLAQTQAAGVTAQIAVTGPASSPAFAISSRPELPQDEELSRILFGNATGELTGFQALQIAQTIAQLSGSAGGFDGLRKALGVDSVDVTASSGGAGVGLTKAVGDRIRLGVRAGTTAADTGVGVDLEVTKRIKLKAQVGVDGNASGGVAAEWDY